MRFNNTIEIFISAKIANSNCDLHHVEGDVMPSGLSVPLSLQLPTGSYGYTVIFIDNCPNARTWNWTI